MMRITRTAMDELESALCLAERDAMPDVNFDAGNCFLTLVFLKGMCDLFHKTGWRFSEIYTLGDKIDPGRKINQTLAELGKRFLNDPAALALIDFESSFGFYNPNDKIWYLHKLARRIDRVNCTVSAPNSAGFADIFERMTEAARKRSGQCRSTALTTANPLAELVAALVSPKSGDRVYDPTCGCGTLLAKVRQKVQNGGVSLYGQEYDEATLTFCKMNMIMREITDVTLWRGETLSDPQNIDGLQWMTFSVVVAAPPFGVRHWEQLVFSDEGTFGDLWGRFKWGVPMLGDFAFTLHSLKCLSRRGGRMAILLPHGVLTRGGTDRVIRRQFVEHNLLDTVVGLPPKLCGNTAIPVCILVFKTGRRDRDVLFIDASAKDKYVAGLKRNRLRRSDIDKIVDVYKTRKSVEGFSRSVSWNELAGNDFDLKVERYVEAPHEIEDRERLTSERKERIVQNQGEWPLMKAQIEKYDNELEQ